MIINASKIFFTNRRIETLDYYKKLGFNVTYDFGFVEREGLEMIIHETNIEERNCNFPRNGNDALDVFCMVSDAEELYNELKDKGARIHYDLRITEFNMKEFAIIDPGGFTIGFGESVSD
jgi:CRISPR/Cas system-associated endonuclease/helicase Cas3